MDRQKSENFNNIIIELLPLEEDELLIFIGNQKFKEALSANSWSPIELIKKVQDWIKTIKPLIKEKICKNEILRNEILDGKLEKKILISHVATLLTELGHTEVTLAAISVYCVNYGFKKICNENIT